MTFAARLSFVTFVAMLCDVCSIATNVTTSKRNLYSVRILRNIFANYARECKLGGKQKKIQPNTFALLSALLQYDASLLTGQSATAMCERQYYKSTANDQNLNDQNLIVSCCIIINTYQNLIVRI